MRLTATWLVGLGLLLAGCHMPADVVRVTDPSQPQTGIRYRLLRPSYTVSLKLRDPAGWERQSWSVPERCDTVAELERHLRDRDAFDLELLIEQSFIEGALYEVQLPWYHLLNPFAESEVDLDLVCGKGQTDGTLKAFTGGVKDRTAEVVQAVVGLVKSVAAAAPPPEPKCVPAWLLDYLKAHVELRAKASEALIRQEALQSSLVAGTITDSEREQLAILKPLVEALTKELAEHRHRLSSDEYSLEVDGEVLVARPAANETPKLFDITLSPHRSAP